MIHQTDTQLVIDHIDQAAAGLAACYDYLPGPVQAQTLELAHALSWLRLRLVEAGQWGVVAGNGQVHL